MRERLLSTSQEEQQHQEGTISSPAPAPAPAPASAPAPISSPSTSSEEPRSNTKKTKITETTPPVAKMEPHSNNNTELLLPQLEELIHLQPTTNIGMIGHVAHGKSTLVRKISGVATARDNSKELERNMTIKLGYANAKVFRCDNASCPRPLCYRATGSNVKAAPRCARPGCNSSMSLVRHISFVDCPGHEVLMATMLNASAIMDAAILVVAANDLCPQPQTAEHLAAADLIGLTDFLVVQNKVDLVAGEEARAQYSDIASFIQGTKAEGAPILPVSAQYGVNIDMLCQYIVEKIPVPQHDLSLPARMMVVRSFDVNKPGTPFEQISGAVLGGSLAQGVLRVGQVLEMRPGRVVAKTNGSNPQQPPQKVVMPLFTRVTGLKSEMNNLTMAVPGGLIGVGTTLDPSFAKADGLVGQVIGEAGSLPDVYDSLEVQFTLMRRLLVGGPNAAVSSASNGDNGEKVVGGGQKVPPLKKGEKLLLNVGSNTTIGYVSAVHLGSSRPSFSAKKKQLQQQPTTSSSRRNKKRTEEAESKLQKSTPSSSSSSAKKNNKRVMQVSLAGMPVCAEVGQKVAISRRVEGQWRLVGYGRITPGSKPLPLDFSYQP